MTNLVSRNRFTELSTPNTSPSLHPILTANTDVPPLPISSSATSVRINYKVRLIDAEGQIVVDRQVPAKEISRHPRISELHQVFGGKVVVSPDGSPNRVVEAGDRVRVETNSESFMDKVVL